MSRTAVITRDVRYEIRIPLDSLDLIQPVVELHDMEIVNDSGVQVFIEAQPVAGILDRAEDLF